MVGQIGDLQRAHDEFGYFCDVFEAGLERWQIDPINTEARIACIVAGRQTGKSLTASWWAVWWAISRPGSHILIVAANDESSKRMLAMARDNLRDSSYLAGSVVEEFSHQLVLTNGSVIRCVPPSERAVRGFSVDLLVIDEAQIVPDEIITAALPTTAAREHSRTVLVGSAGPAMGVFYDMCRQGQLGSQHISFHRWVSKLVGGDIDTPWDHPVVHRGHAGDHVAAEVRC